MRQQVSPVVSGARVSGAGLGLRRALMDPLADCVAADRPAFLEVAPENWMRLGGRLGRRFREFTERYDFVTHGLSLSIGGPAPLDLAFIDQVKNFLDMHGIADYSEHLSYCTDDGHLYDLMPIPFTEEAVHHVAGRVKIVQDVLQRRIALENVSYYAAPGARMSELAFVNAVLAEADCDLLLDVNNIAVNSINHRYDARAFLHGLPLARVRYIHVAGHYVEAEDLRVDTHGSAVSDPVWELLDEAYALLGPVPTLLERDFNIPPMEELQRELGVIRTLQARQQAPRKSANG